jgi:Protein of unknown function (DUF2974)
VCQGDNPLKDLGLQFDGNDLTDLKGTDFKCDVFVQRDLPGRKNKYTIAFRGTETYSDWKENYNQVKRNDAPYYMRAMRIAQSAQAAVGSERIQFVGHSLGGGLASAASAASGARATTFNSAALQIGTVDKFEESEESLPIFSRDLKNLPVEAFYVKGEMLSTLQDNSFDLSPSASGKRHVLMPADGFAMNGEVGRVVRSILPTALAVPMAAVDVYKSKNLHKMTSVNDALSKKLNELRTEQKKNGCN